MFKKLVFAVKSILIYLSWDPYRPRDFWFLTVLPTQTKKSQDFDTYNSLKKHHNFSKNEDLLSEKNFKKWEECFVWASNISYFS
jgi:hypothetical protein